MIIREFGDEGKPVMLLCPGTCCWWKGNFGGVLDGLQRDFRVAIVSYSGFDEDEPDGVFDTVTNETEQLERVLQMRYGGHLRAAYGSSMGGSIVGLLVARKVVHVDRAILGSTDLDQANPVSARLKSHAVVPVIYQLLHDGEIKNPSMRKLMDEKMAETGEYGKALLGALGVGARDASFVKRRSIENLFVSDLTTPLPRHIDVPGTEVHILYALKMGPQYRERYLRHFAHPHIHEFDLQHEELLASYPERWLEVVRGICGIS